MVARSGVADFFNRRQRGQRMLGEHNSAHMLRQVLWRALQLGDQLDHLHGQSTAFPALGETPFRRKARQSKLLKR